MNQRSRHDPRRRTPNAVNPQHPAAPVYPPQPTVQHRPVPPQYAQPPAHQPGMSYSHAPAQQRRPVTVSRRAPQPQLTVPNPAYNPNAPRTLPPRPSDTKRRKGTPIWVIGAAAFGVAMLLFALVVLMIGMSALGSSDILPGVSVAGVNVGGLSVEEATAKLSNRWPVMRLTDGATGRQWQIEPQNLGLIVDARQSAERAYRYGRNDGRFLAALFGGAVTPVLNFDSEIARAGLEELADDIAMPAVDAGITLENGRVRATPARDGRTVNLEATISVLASDAVGWLTHGDLPLKMVALAPSVTDASPMIAAAEQLLASPLVVDVFDPFTGDVSQWSSAPSSWAGWLRAEADSSSSTGLRLSLDESALRAFIEQGQAQLTGTQFIKSDKLLTDMQQAVRSMDPHVQARVYHHDRQRTVQSGETIISIAYDEGVPYPWIQQANGGIQHVTAGQTITIPSPDNFFQFEPVMNKRIVISLSQQRAWVYENGSVKWEWSVSTGINSSPTWPGVYQIISHVDNAYAGNWNLWMPWFMGVYQPIPGADFTNGFHGFPTRGGGQILWENSIGTRVTYGCILLSNTNVQQLYSWAENGVIVEIRA